MKIERRQLDECHGIALAIAPELQERTLLVIEADSIRDHLPASGCLLGFANSAPLVDVVERCGDHDVLIALDGKAIAEASKPDWFARAVRSILVHEVAHLVPLEPVVDLPTRREFLRIRQRMAIERTYAQAPNVEPATDPHHGIQFFRRALHLWVRCQFLGQDVPLGGVFLYGVCERTFLPHILAEAADLRDKTFAEIETIEPPAAFVREFQEWRNWREWRSSNPIHRERNRALPKQQRPACVRLDI